MNNDNRLDDILDILIEEACIETADELGKSYPEPEHNHVFSKKHEAKMQKLFKKERNKLLFKKVIKYSQRVALFIIVVIFLSGITVFSVQAWRVKFLNFLLEITQVDTNIKFVDENYSGDSYSNDYISLDYIPTGFQLKSSAVDGNWLNLIFKKDDKYFGLSLDEVGVSLSIDTENADIEKITINGMEALYSTNNNANILVWHDADYVYTLAGNLEESELIKIAENIKK